MPTYDYECPVCGHAFERYQPISAKKLRKCPRCGKRRLVRLVGPGAMVLFRGSGFYETDYRRTGGKSGGATGSSPAAEGGPKGRSEE